MNVDSDEDLVKKAVGGDTEAFADLLGRNYATIYRVAYHFCPNQHDAEDIAQDVCVKLGRSIRGFNGRSQFSSWLYTIILNTAHDHRKKGVPLANHGTVSKRERPAERGCVR